MHLCRACWIVEGVCSHLSFPLSASIGTQFWVVCNTSSFLLLLYDVKHCSAYMQFICDSTKRMPTLVHLTVPVITCSQVAIEMTFCLGGITTGILSMNNIVRAVLRLMKCNISNLSLTNICVFCPYGKFTWVRECFNTFLFCKLHLIPFTLFYCAYPRFWA